MSEHVTIEDLGEKIELLIRSGKSLIKSHQILLVRLGVTKDWFSRVRNGLRQLTEERFLKLSEVFDLPQKEWYVPLVEFGHKLGFSRHQVYQITQKYVPGIDFGSRIKDPKMIQDVFRQISGYWESFYFSASKLGKKVVSRDFMYVSGVNEDGFIECEIIDKEVSYVGWCFPMKSHLYFILEKDKIFNEIIVYCTNLPDRPRPRLYGIILCLSGGVDETHTYPAGARCAFRYLGNDDEVRKRYKLDQSRNVRNFLVEENTSGDYYIDPTDRKLDKETREIFKTINNVIPKEQIPAVLRMVK